LVTIPLAILGGISSYFISDGYYQSRTGELVAQATHGAQEDADDLADSIRRNLHYLSGIPDFLSQGLRVQNAVAHFAQGETPSSLPYEVKKRRWLKDPVLNELNQTLAHAQSSLNADLVYVVDAAGDSIASSNWDTPGSTIGTNYAERDYFRQNKAGQRGMQYAVGKTTHIAGLYFSSPIVIKGKFMGAVVAKVDVPKLSFLTKLTDAFVTDRNGVIILAHDQPMEMKVLPDGALHTMPQQDIINHYQRSDFQTLQIGPWGKGEFASVQRINGEDVPHLLATRELPEYGLTVHVENELPAMLILERQRSWIPLWTGIALSFLVLIGGIAAYYFQLIRRAKRQLLKSQNRLATLLQTSIDGVVGMDVHGRITLWNDSAEQMFGWRSEEVLGKQLHTVIIPERYREQHLRGLEKFNSTGEAKVLGHRIEIFALKRDGREFAIELAIAMVENEGRREFGAFVRDISRRRRAEAQLLESERSYRELMEQAADAIFVVDHEGYRFLDVNHAACEMLGYTRDELLRMGVLDLLDPADTIHEPIRFAEMYAGQTIHMQRRYRRKDGSYISAELRARMLADGRLQAIVRDISARKAIEEAVRKREEQYHAVIETSVEGFWMVDMQGRLLEVNSAYERQSGYNRQELLAMRVSDLEAVEHPEEIAAHINKIMRDGHDRFETRHRRKDGRIWPVEVVTTFWREGNLIFAFFTDITELKQAAERAQLAAKIYQASSEAIMVTDENNRIIEINPAFTRITGYTLEEVAGKNPNILQSGKHDKEFYRVMWQAILNEGGWQGEIWDRRKNGMLYAKWATINVLYHTDGSVYRHVAQFSDITEKKQQDELILRQASFDTLTGLPNRRLFRDRLEIEIKKADKNRAGLPLALLYLDLDRFKEINDTLGHAKGDILLVEAARRIRKCVRETDTVARLGGDEFTVILPEVGDQSQPERIALAISGELEKPFDLGDGHIGYVSASVGITLYPNDAGNYEELVKHADQAMYAAKSLGRNRFSFFTASMQQGAREKLALTNDLRQALARNELQVYYQPILELGSGRITKAEALLRWKHPARGMVSPAVFIPLAEEAGLIYEIGEWVFRQSIAQVAEWYKLFGNIIQVSVNKSPAQFEHPGKHTWAEQMKKLGLPGNGITVEITEGLLFKESAKAKERLLEFRNSGIEVSIDDFGTGFSSLSYLKQFDIDYIKIDRSFVKDLEQDQDDKALTEAIIVMAHKLGIKTIAEGVETEAQRDLLASFGCDYWQGFLYSPAVPADEFRKLLEKKAFEAGS
jgi:diguanylate cyclase (GGDEF)-like protein/PAS domain S-box-containing protein